MTATEGFVSFRGMRTWYRIAGDMASGKIPLLLLHGGPGGSSDAFEPLEALVSTGRAVVRYDQIGCGYSDRPKDPALWTVATFLDELATVRRELGLDRVHLLGWSWGGMLAMEYLFTQPAGVVSLILASSPAKISLHIEEARRLRDELPRHVVRAMRRFEDSYKPNEPTASAKVGRPLTPKTVQRRARALRGALGVVERPSVVRIASWASAVPFLRRAAYDALTPQFVSRHMIRMKARDIPLPVLRSFAGVNRQVYETMCGPSEFFVVGNLKDWEAASRLDQITVPTLITSGRYDEITPTQIQLLHDGISGSRWVLFEESAHCAFVEEPERYRAVVGEFIDEVESGISA